ncbi:RnfABCDGE type electron transport complex subunit B [Neisseriaceae bacterium B1]
MNPETLNQLLPQTQCRECGFSGCLPYAQAMANGEAEINLCAPGGIAVIHDLAAQLRLPEIAPAKQHRNTLAWIDEAVCIGCTACIRACPVDAIMGASKLMHTVLADECTGCGLCVAPCPVDCIYMQETDDEYLPRARFLANDTRPRFAAAEHARIRYEAHESRRAEQAKVRHNHVVAHKNSAKSLSGSQSNDLDSGSLKTENTTKQANQSQPENPAASISGSPALNAAALIAQAMARAQAQQSERVVPINRDRFRETQIQAAQEKALFRRYQQQANTGNAEEKAAAIAWLRQYKKEQEAKELAKNQS